MQGTVTLGGYVVPVEAILTVLALLVGLALTASFALTVGWSVYRSVVDSRRERRRPDLRAELLDRLFAEEPEWTAWVDGLSATDRAVVESLLDEHLRELSGSDAERLQELGDALGIPERAGRTLARGEEYERLRALTWLTLLERPGPFLASAYEPRTARERATAARLLRRSDALADPAEGLALLLDGAEEGFSVFGQDTLYRVAQADPDTLFAMGAEQARDWPDPLLAQVLDVCGHLGTGVRTDDLAWLTGALESDAEGVRAAAARALGSFGWQPALRETAFFERATDDPSPQVRAAVYRMLSAWGDEEALTVLLYALVSESDPRALVRGTSALVDRRDRLDEGAPAVLGTAWTWSSEHADYDSVARGHTERARS